MVSQSTLEVARVWKQAGAAPIPIPHKSKCPAINEWQLLDIADERLADYFNGEAQNIGILLGRPSGGIVDIDLDCPEAIEAGRILLPDTFTFGRPSAPESHKLYRAPGLQTRKFQYSGEMLVELRSSGCQTVVPNSTHISGEPIRKHGSTQLAAVADPQGLERGVELVAVAAMTARFWKAGSRHQLTLDLTGALLHGGIQPERIARLMSTILDITDDPEKQDRLRAVKDTLMLGEQGEKITGLPALSEHMPAEYVKNLQRWLGLGGFSDLIIKERTVLEAADEWPEAVPLYRDMPEAEDYPVESLGEILGGAVRDITAIIKAPAALAAQSVLAAASLAVQAHADVGVDGRCCPVSENFLSVAISGERKTSTDRAATAPHRKWRKNQMGLYQDAKRLYDRDMRAWQRRAAKEDDPGDQPIRPRNPMLTTEEPTYEGLVKLLELEWPTLGLFSSEGGRFLAGHAMNSENRRKTIAGLNTLWDGEPISRTRVDECVLLYGRRLSAHLMAQPRIATTLLEDADALDMGLSARCLIVYPTSTVGSRTYVTEALHEQPGYLRYFARMMDILECELPLVGDAAGELVPRELRLDAAAYKEWVGYHDHIEARIPSELPDVVAAAAKSAEHVLRLAGILALVEDINCAVINHAHVVNAIELAQFYLGEAQRLCQPGKVETALEEARQLGRWAQKRGQPVKVREMCQLGPRPMRTRAAVHQALLLLQQHGWARKVSERPEEWEVRSDAIIH